MGSDMPVATVANEDSKNVIKNPHPLRRRFTDREGSRNAKVGLDWRYFSDNHDITLVHSNTKILARVLHEYWVDQYTRRTAKPKETKISAEGDDVFRILKPVVSEQIRVLPYEEPENENLFWELLVIQDRVLGRLEVTERLVIG